MRFFGLLICFLFSYLSATSQYAHLPVLPDLDGQLLLNELPMDYKPSGFLMSYGQTRDTLYSRVYRYKDSVTCVYTGHQIYLPPTGDPTTILLQGGSSNGINTEHSYPRSKGAEFNNPKVDMHHLFPTRAAVNSARGNAPYGEIDDDLTEQWFYLTFNFSSEPVVNKDLYSEQRGDFGQTNIFRFEPREDFKGNAARAIFYFYTMYRDEADDADPTFFEKMRTTLCEWHHQDPVDSLEWARTFKIAEYQEGKPNPFVLDCTLPQRSYCQDVNLICIPPATSTFEPKQSKLGAFSVFPNPVADDAQISFKIEEKGRVVLEVFNSLGQAQGTLYDEVHSPGVYQVQWSPDTDNYSGATVLFLKVSYANGRVFQSDVKRVVIGG